MHFDEHLAALRARPDVVRGMDAWHATDNFGDAPGRHGGGVYEYGHGGLENLVAAPRDDHGDTERDDRVEPDVTGPDQDQAGEHRATDQHVAASVRGIGDQKSALQPSPFPPLVNRDENVADDRSDHHADGQRGDFGRGRVASDNAFDRAQRDLIAGNEEKSGDGEGGQRFEFGVAVGVAFVRLRRCVLHHHQTDDVVERIDRRMNGVADYAQTAGEQARDQLGGDDHDVERERH